MRQLLSLYPPNLPPVHETSPAPIPFLSPRVLSQLHLHQAVHLLMDRAGAPLGDLPALAFDVSYSPSRLASTPPLEWMTFPCLPGPSRWDPHPEAIRRRREMQTLLRRPAPDPYPLIRYLHLGAWLLGGFQIPIYAPGRLLPGRCPLALFLDGTFEAHLADTYHMVLMKP